MEVAPQLFSILFHHDNSGEGYWLERDFTVVEQLPQYTSRRPLEEWRSCDIR